MGDGTPTDANLLFITYRGGSHLTSDIRARGYYGIMRKKELKLVVTFHTTADAMAMEQVCRDRGTPGRLIPVPRTISAGCGLAWCAGLEYRDELKRVMQCAGILEEDMHECMI